MSFPAFLQDENCKPHGPYEWSLWCILQVAMLASMLVAVPFIVFIGIITLAVDILTGDL